MEVESAPDNTEMEAYVSEMKRMKKPARPTIADEMVHRRSMVGFYKIRRVLVGKNLKNLCHFN